MLACKLEQGRRADDEADEDGCEAPGADQFVPEDEVVETVPFFGFYAADDGVLRPLGWDGFAEGDGDGEPGLSTFRVDFGVDEAGFVPGVGALGDVLG